ncbi:putative T7SS-secreted protein [Streptomyces sp. NPDC058372]|uniref:putative T7SS-secreted protein n=1 Tax=Streptomyces sp. NPDC058372 TaxID=3346464 RepID=UPI003668C8DC
MSSRPASHRWEVVGESSDPVPGDPEDVARLGRELRKTAEAIEKQAGEIKALASVEAWKSKTAEEFREQAEGAGDKLRKAFRRYDEASQALGTTVNADVCSTQYASELARAQKMADKALSDAEAADEDIRSAKSALSAQPDDTPKDDPATKRHEKAEENATSALKAAKEAVASAKGIRDAAAKRAADAIHDVIEDDGLKDGWKDKFQNWVHENSGWLKEISKWAGRIALWAGLLALAVGWIPVIGQIAAAVLNAIALIASITALAVDLTLYLGGEGSLKAVILDAVGVATFGLGRAAIAGGKAASAGARALARSSLYKQMVAGGAKIKDAWKFANRGGTQGGLRGKEAADALANMPKRGVPSWANIKEGFSPSAIAKDTWEGVTTLGPKWGDMAWPRSLREYDPDLARAGEALRDISDAGSSLGEVAKVGSSFSGMTNVWAGSTATGLLAGAEGAYGAVTDSVTKVSEVGNDLRDRGRALVP